jgi:copper chaperone CopZ
MIRRQFIQFVALTGIGALNPLETVAASGPGSKLVFQVQGFTCITCAVGLDTLLGKQEGILSSHSTYPEGVVTVVFDPQQSSEEAIRAFIAQIGFKVVSSRRA